MNAMLPYSWYLELIEMKNKKENSSTQTKVESKKDWVLVNNAGNQ